MDSDDATGELPAVLAAEVVDYARLVAADEHATVTTLYAYRDLVTERVEEHGGRVLDLSGEKVLSELPSAVQGARCALAIQSEIDRRNQAVPFDRIMTFRMAVHAAARETEGPELEAIEVATFVETLASPGGICVSGPVHTAIAALLPVRFEDLGEHPMAGAPVHVWRVQGTESDAPQVDRATRGWPVTWAPIAAACVLGVALLGWLVLGGGEPELGGAALAAQEWSVGADGLALLRTQADEQNSRDPTSSEAYRARARVALVAREHEIAVAESEQALEQSPNNVEALALLAGAHLYSGRAPRALETARRGIEIDPGFVGLYYVVGRAQRQLGRREDAIHTFEQSLAYEPANASGLANLAVLYAEADRTRESQLMVERLRSTHPEFSGADYAQALPFADPLDAERLAQGLRRVELP